MSFKDHFSKQADDYAKYRPAYPRELFEYLASLAPARLLAWDCGTGNGQAALGLAEFFGHVIATDPSEAQIRNATPHASVEYRVAPAEQTDIGAGTVDLVTVAQALHWFDHERFYAEAKRVLKPGGVLAAWCYGLNEIAPAIDPVVRHFYSGVVGPHWPPERRFIDERYASIPFPPGELVTPAFHIEAHWNLDDFIGYLNTWSATQRYRKAEGRDPLPALRDELIPVWGPADTLRSARWPIYLRAVRLDRAG
jgi:SAM-dependent methyltransferase